jgi:hypothetical protein
MRSEARFSQHSVFTVKSLLRLLQADRKLLDPDHKNLERG